MITEDYVSFEIAKALKQKEVDRSLFEHYHCWLLDVNTNLPFLTDLKLVDEKAYFAPTLQSMMKYLREHYHIHIRIYERYSGNADNDIMYYYCMYHYKDGNSINPDLYEDGEFISYEECAQAAIEYAVESLI